MTKHAKNLFLSDLIFSSLLLLICGTVWPIIFYAHGALNLFSALGSFLLCVLLVTILCLIFKIKNRILNSGFVSFFLFLGINLISVTWSVISYLNYVSLSNWGDTSTLNLVRGYFKLDNDLYIEISDRLAAEGPKLMIFAGLVVLGFYLLSILFRKVYHYFRAPVAVQLILILAIGCSLIFKPDFLYKEPVSSFLLNKEYALELRSGARQEAAKEDQIIRKDYQSSVHPQKNVFLIVFDSLRARSLPMYGYDKNNMPFLNELYQSGQLKKVDYAFATCPDSLCGISSILTSRTFFKISQQSLKFYELLARLGYYNELVLVGEHREFGGLGKFYGENVRRFDAETAGVKDLENDQIALEFIKTIKNNDQPRFMFFFMMSPHVMGKRFPEFNQFGNYNFKNLPFYWSVRGFHKLFEEEKESPALLQDFRNNYDNSLLQSDWIVQQLFTKLREEGLLENALVIITGDHGDSLGEHNHLGHGEKLYNENIQVPLLIWDSEPIDQLNKYGAHVDIAPTIFERLGLKIPATWSGKPLTVARDRFNHIVITRKGNDPCGASIKEANEELYKLIYCKKSVPREEIYNLSLDPLEEQSLLDQPTAIDQVLLQEMRSDLLFLKNEEINTCFRVDCLNPENNN